MEKNIAIFTRLVLESSLLSEISQGKFDRIIEMDMESIIKKYNAGDRSVLDSEEIKSFVNNNEQISSLICTIAQLKSLLALKKFFLKKVEDKKDKMIYNPNDVLVIDYNRHCTYQDVFDAMAIAEKFLNDKKIYQILNFYLKYETLIKKIRERRFVFSSQEKSREISEKFLELLKIQDNNVGIIRTEINEEGKIKILVNVGTKKDMALSDLIGKPFEADMDRMGYDYGPHGDYYMPSRKVTKTFHENGETNLHRKMIQDERLKRIRLERPRVDEDGYIICGGCSIIVSKRELIDARINPEAVDWKPLKLEVIPIRLTELTRPNGRKYTFAEIVEMKTELLKKGRK